MKPKIHPNYVQAHVRCTCGNEFMTRATRDELHVEVCSNCHPFYTGRQKLMDTGGRVERFTQGGQGPSALSEIGPHSSSMSSGPRRGCADDAAELNGNGNVALAGGDDSEIDLKAQAMRRWAGRRCWRA